MLAPTWPDFYDGNPEEPRGLDSSPGKYLATTVPEAGIYETPNRNRPPNLKSMIRERCGTTKVERDAAPDAGFSPRDLHGYPPAGP